MKPPKTTQPSKLQTAIELKHQQPAPVPPAKIAKIQQAVQGKGAGVPSK